MYYRKAGKCCHKKSLLYKNYRKNSTSNSRDKYLRYRKKLRSILVKAKKEYYITKFELYAGNLRETWKLFCTVLNKNTFVCKNCTFIKSDGSLTNSPQEVVEVFNNFFVCISNELS